MTKAKNPRIRSVTPQEKPYAVSPAVLLTDSAIVQMTPVMMDNIDVKSFRLLQ